MSKFKFPIDDTKDEIDDELEYFTDDSWQDYDPEEDGDDEDGYVPDDQWEGEEDE